MRKQNTRLYLHNVAQTMMAQLEVPQKFGASGTGAQDIYFDFGDRIKSKLLGMTPATRGCIADLGLAWTGCEFPKISLYQVHCGSYLGKYNSGRDLVTEIACTAIVAMMYEILSRSHRCHRGMADARTAKEELEDCSTYGPQKGLELEWGMRVKR